MVLFSSAAKGGGEGTVLVFCSRFHTTCLASVPAPPALSFWVYDIITPGHWTQANLGHSW